MGIKIRPDIRGIIDAIERKTGNENYVEFGELDEFMFGASFTAKDGIPVVDIDYKLQEGGDNPKPLLFTNFCICV